MTQHERIIEYIKENGSITPMEAFSELGITKLSTRIGELEKGGFSFSKEFIRGKNRYGEPVHYMEYRLRGEAGATQL